MLNALNEEIVIRLQEAGIAVPSMTQIGTKLAIRVAITNHRSRREDFDILVSRVVEAASGAQRPNRVPT